MSLKLNQAVFESQSRDQGDKINGSRMCGNLTFEPWKSSNQEAQAGNGQGTKHISPIKNFDPGRNPFNRQRISDYPLRLRNEKYISCLIQIFELIAVLEDSSLDPSVEKAKK